MTVQRFIPARQYSRKKQASHFRKRNEAKAAREAKRWQAKGKERRR